MARGHHWVWLSGWPENLRPNIVLGAWGWHVDFDRLWLYWRVAVLAGVTGIFLCKKR